MTINGEIDKLHHRAKGLLEVVLQAKDDELESIRVTSPQFCELLYAENNGDYQRDFSRADDSFSRYIPEDVTLSQLQKTVWLDAILVMEVNANLTDKDKMCIYTITAELSEFASSPIAALFGFLGVRFRQHDCLVGRFRIRTRRHFRVA